MSGVGDTFGTCFGPLSRNRNFGIRLGKGESMEEILASSTEVRNETGGREREWDIKDTEKRCMKGKTERGKIDVTKAKQQRLRERLGRGRGGGLNEGWGADMYVRQRRKEERAR